MAVYKRLLVTGPNGTTANSVTDTAASNFYGYKSITLEESFKTTSAAAARVAFIKKNPTAMIKGDEDYSDTPTATLSGATLESWNITEKTRVFQVDKDGNEVTDPSTQTATGTSSTTHVILKYTIKIQDFWVKS